MQVDGEDSQAPRQAQDYGIEVDFETLDEDDREVSSFARFLRRISSYVHMLERDCSSRRGN